MDEINLDEDSDKVFEVEPQSIGEEATGFSAQAQRDEFLGGSSEKSADKKGSRIYEIDGLGVRVNFNLVTSETTTKGENPNKEKLVVFLPGWSMGASTPTAESIAMGFAKAGETDVLIADNLSDETKDDYII